MLSQGIILNASGGSLIYPGLTEGEFLSSPFGLKAVESIINGDDRSFDIESVAVANELFSLRVFFNCGQLRMLNLYLIGEFESGSWSDWSEEKEQQKKAKHDKFLMNVLGEPPYVFDWGEVVSIFDRKGGYSSIVISYKH